jgi:hypothetical protein
MIAKGKRIRDIQHAYPPALNVIGFFEDFFDDQREAVATFWQVVNQRLALAVV